jgi:hypothetical protein
MSAFRQFVRYMVATAVMLSCASGCQLVQPYRPVSVAVVDAETKRPIPGASVEVTAQEHRDSTEKSGPNGIARVQAAAYRDSGSSVEVHAAGYFEEQQYLALETIKTIEPPGWFERMDRRPPNLTIELYAEPRPKIVLVVPANYHGVVKAGVEIHDDVSSPGQRDFRCEVSPTGEVIIVGSGVLKHIGVPDFSFVLADGTPISRNATETEIGYWWEKYEGGQQWFFVGNKAEYAEFRADEKKRDLALGRSNNGNDKGGGRGGRRGGRRGSQSN